MKRYVNITGPATADVFANRDWWAKHRDSDQADCWLTEIYRAVWDLATTADRYGHAAEPALQRAGIRQRNFGLGSRPTHLILYAIRGVEVIAYRVRSAHQDQLGVVGLGGAE